MFLTDDYYGHRRVLADYVGLDRPRPILAHLQHGWNAFDGFGRQYLEGRVLSYRLDKLVWNDTNLAESRRAGVEHLAAVGAPFLYLDEVLGGHAEPASEGTIVYPIHAGSSHDAHRDGEEAFVEEVLEREDGPVTFCLYWREYDDPEIRKRYQRGRAQVITHGHRDQQRFLHRQREALLAHRRVVSNRVSTAVFYGGALGLEMSVYGPVFGSGDAQEAAFYVDHQRERWPQLCDAVLAGDEALACARVELGANHLRSPDELAELLGWTGWKHLVGPVAHAGAAAGRRAKALLADRR